MSRERLNAGTLVDRNAALPTLFPGAMRIGAVPAPVSFPDALDNFRRYVRDRCEHPHFTDFVDELPKTPTGKIQRYELRERG